MRMTFCGTLLLTLVGLKLTGLVDWSWLLILAPLWVPFCWALVVEFADDAQYKDQPWLRKMARRSRGW